MIQAHYRDRLLWFRIFGYGLHIRDTRRHRPLWSERNGRRGRFFGPWLIKILRPFHTGSVVEDTGS